MGKRLNAFVFGGCHTRLSVKASPLAAERLRMGRYGMKAVMHTFGEMFQLIEVLRRDRVVDEELRRIARIPEPLDKFKDAFRELDVAIVELGSMVEIGFRGLSLNRKLLGAYILKVIGRKRPMAAKTFATWLRVGVVGMNESVRQQTAEQLAAMVPQDSPQEELARAIIFETRGSRPDVLASFARMREMLSCPIGVVLWTFRYMPDGRPITWPANLREDVIDAARQLDLPIFDPAPFVRRHGVSKALLEDFAHYQPEFKSFIGDELVKFMEAAHGGLRFSTPPPVDITYTIEDFQNLSKSATA